MRPGSALCWQASAVAEMQIPFSLRGLQGMVAVEVVANDDPARWGYRLFAGTESLDQIVGFPVCTARVTYPAEGYAAVFGWVQLAQSTDSSGDPTIFEVDPIQVYEQVATPFAWFGVTPVLFDAPSRESTYSMRWRARSWLCTIPDAVISRDVVPVCGFDWGFDIDGRAITLAPPAELSLGVWHEHLLALHARFPTWTFHEAPLRSG